MKKKDYRLCFSRPFQAVTEQCSLEINVTENLFPAHPKPCPSFFSLKKQQIVDKVCKVPCQA